MKRFAVIGALIFGAAEIGAFGCNAVLGNDDGHLLADASTALTCAANQKACGACVDTTDPKVGCGGECTVCPTPMNGRAGCELQSDIQTCDLASCNAQFGDCNGDASDGCETHTTTKDNCGECGSPCGLEPFCEPSRDSGTGYACSYTCDSPYITCAGKSGAECIDPKTDNQNCGVCGTNCTVTNGSGTCEDGGCNIKCDTNTFLCNGECITPTNAQCGATCAACTGSTHCDKTAGDSTYGQCIPNGGGADAGCASGLVCNAKCCNVGQNCCNAQCSDETDNACGSNCDNCASGATCKPALHTCGCSAGNTLCSDNSMPRNDWCCPTGTTTCGANPGECPATVTPICIPSCGGMTRCCCPGGATGVDSGGATGMCEPQKAGLDGSPGSCGPECN